MPSRHFSRKPLRSDAGEEGDPLGTLRRRCIIGAGSSFGIYLAVVAASVLLPDTLTLTQAIGLEVGIGIIFLLCAIVATVIWLLTESTAFVLSVSKAVSAASTANAALESKLLGNAGPDGTPIPIQRGRDIRQHRTDRHAG